MTYKVSTVLDFVARSKDPTVWRMILVEEGPWEGSEVSSELSRLQDRLYDCVDAAIDGQLAQKFPETLNKIIKIQLDGYNLPETEVSEFFRNFSENVLTIDDYLLALKDNEFISEITFELNLQKI